MMMMKSVFWWRKPGYLQETTDLPVYEETSCYVLNLPIYLPIFPDILAFMYICTFCLPVLFTWVPYDVQYGTRSIWPILLYTFQGDATLTIGPYGSAGMCNVVCILSSRGCDHNKMCWTQQTIIVTFIDSHAMQCESM